MGFSSGSGSERRKHRRFPVGMKVQFQVEDRTIDAETSNVSAQGFHLLTTESLAIGAMISFSLAHEALGDPFLVIGRVAHLQADPTTGSAGVGVEIARISKDQESQLQKYRELVQRQPALNNA